MLSAQILELDPLVSDTACHTRAAYLIYLARKRELGSLTEAETQYLLNCDILTQTQNRKYDDFGNIIFEKTDNQKLPASCLPSNKKDSNTLRNKTIAEKKTAVAKATIQFLQNECDLEIQKDVPDPVPYEITLDGQRIPVLPLYQSSKMMLNYAAKATIPLIVKVKRMRVIDNIDTLEGVELVTYALNEDKTRFIPQSLNEATPGIKIDMVCSRETGADFLNAGTFANFMIQFKEQNIAGLIMLCAIAHAQFPPSAKPPKDYKPEMRESKEGAAQNDLQDSPFTIKLNECSSGEYRQLTGIAKKYGIFQDAAKKIRPSLMIDHVSTSTLKICLDEIRDMLDRLKSLEAKLTGEVKLEVVNEK